MSFPLTTQKQPATLATPGQTRLSGKHVLRVSLLLLWNYSRNRILRLPRGEVKIVTISDFYSNECHKVLVIIFDNYCIENEQPHLSKNDSYCSSSFFHGS